MLRSLTTVFFLAGLVLARNPARAGGSPEAGQDVAADWCSRCHDFSRQGQMKQGPALLCRDRRLPEP
jgi:cytochrome c2